MNRLADISRAAETLRLEMPKLVDWLEPGRRLEGLSAWDRRSRAWEAVPGEPPLVAALYGPTGAGKSTLFKLLSGVEVPMGEHRRPMSRSCALAVPSNWADPAKLGLVFPLTELVPLGDGSALAVPGQPLARVHTAEAPALSRLGPGGGALLLVDAPDYNGVDADNALRAEEILLRAEVMVFVLQADSYLVARNVEELARAARLATRLMVLLTKAGDSFQAWTAWDDLCRRLEDAGGVGAPFAVRRSDGRTCLEVVRSAPVYAWRRSEQPSLEDIKARSGPGLVDCLAGFESRRVAWEGVAGAADEAAKEARALVARARRERETAKSLRERLAADARDAGARVAGSEFPLGAVIQELVAKSRPKVPLWWKFVVGIPASLLFGSIKFLVGKAGEFLGYFKNIMDTSKAENLKDVELRNLEKEADFLLDIWRSRPELAGLGLDSTRCSQARAALVGVALPGVSVEWKEALRLEAERWVKENSSLALALTIAFDGMAVAGIGLLVIDLFTTGGLFGTAVVAGKIGVGGAVAGGAGVLGVLGRFAGTFNLEQVLKSVDAKWCETRAAALSAHIEKHLVSAVAAPLDAILDRADENRLAALEQAAGVLESAASNGPAGTGP